MTGAIPRAGRLLAGAVVVLVVSCAEPSDQRTDQVVAGMSRDSALAVLSLGGGTSSGESAPADSMTNIWRRTQYLVDGQSIEVLWYSSIGEKWTVADTVPEGRIIPVVLIDGKVVGVGPSAYAQVAGRYNLPKNKY